jgi:hypothetical protein
MKQRIEELEVVIEAEISQFNKQMEKVNKTLDTMQKQSGAAAASVGGAAGGGGMALALTAANVAAQAITGTFRVLGRVIGRAAQEIFKGGTQLSRMRIATNTVASNMGIAAEEVDSLRDSLAEANTYGIKAEQVINSLARTGLFEMAKQLEAVDGRTGETVKGISALVLEMKDLGAVAGMSSSEAIAKVTEFINRGETAMVDQMIAVGNLGTEYRVFAESIGKTRAELTAQEEAEARLMLVHRESKKALGAYANAYTTAGKMMDSLKDATSSIFEEVGSALEPVFATAASAILEFVQGVRNWVRSNWETIREWAINVAAWVTTVVRVIGAALARIRSLGAFLGDLVGFELATGGAVSNTNVQLEEQKEAMDSAAAGAKALKKQMAGLAGFDEMNVLKEPESTGGGGGGGLVEDGTEEAGSMLESVGKQVNEKTKETETAFQRMWEKIKNYFQPITDFWNENVKPAFEGMVAQFKMLGKTISESPIGAILKVIAQLIVGVVVGAFMALISVVMWVITGITRLIEKGVQRFTDRFNFLVDILAEVILVFRNLPEIVSNTVAAVKEWIENLVQSAKDNFNMMKENLIAIWENLKQAIERKIKEIVIKIAIKIIELYIKWLEFKDKVNELWENIQTKIREVVDNIRNWVATRIQNIKNTFLGIYNTVRDTFNRIKNHIWNTISGVVDRVRSKIQSFKDGFKDFFGDVVVEIKKPINYMIDRINALLDKVRGIKIPGIAPNGINIPRIPRLATGGVIESPTVAMLGEAGREAVVPLENNTEWIDTLASKLGGTGGGQIHLTVKVGEDKVGEKIIEYINDKNARTNLNTLNI